jgi:hypothetical protein
VGGLAPGKLARTHAGPALIAALALLIVFAGLWSSGYPRGADTWGHLYKAEYLAQQMHQHGLGAYFTAAWMPDWYMGDPFRTYYPPLTTLILAPLVYVVGDPFLAFRLFASLVWIALAGLTYLFVNQTWGRWQAGLAAALVVLAPYQLRTLLFEGNLPRVLSLLALPPIAYLGERLLERRGRMMPLIVGLAACWVWAILAHPQQAMMFAIGFAIYIVMRLFLDPDVPLRRGIAWLAGLAAGGILSMPWALPAYGRGELANIPYLPAVKVDLFSAPLNAILPTSSAADGRVLFGTGILMLALLVAAARPDPRRTGYVLAGLVTMWFSLGPKGVAFSLLPLNQQLLPERFLNFTAFALAIGASGILPLVRRARVARAFVLFGLVFVDLYPSFNLLPNRPFPTEQATLAQAAAGQADSISRLALITYPDPSALEVYYAGLAGPLINGWALENTPHHPALRRVLSAPEWSPEYFEHLMDIWNVRLSIVRGGDARGVSARAALQQAGFTQKATQGIYEIWVDEHLGTPALIPSSQRMLVLGDGLPPALMTYPFAEESVYPQLSQLPQGALEHYPAAALFRFESDSGVLASDQARLQNYLEQGGTVVLDLSGMENAFGQTLQFLGINVTRLAFSDEIPLRWTDGLAAANLPTSLQLGVIAPEGWSGATYNGLDGILAEAEYNGQWWPVLGYRNIGNGRAWFIGLNLLYYSQLSGQAEIANIVRQLTLSKTTVDQSLRMQPLPVTVWSADSHGLLAIAEAANPIPEVVLSYTYSPRWQVYVDGAPQAAGNYEHLIKISLLPGTHRIEVRYKPYGTIWPVAGLALGLLGAGGLVGGFWLEKRRFIPLPEDKAVKLRVEEKQYAPCANCGFRLAEMGAPTPITYPFQVVRCPICGMVMDDDGFQPGTAMTQDEKAGALAAWLRNHNYDPKTVHERWGFAVADFFADPQSDEYYFDGQAQDGTEDVQPDTDR